MDFVEIGGDVGFDQYVCVGYCFGCWVFLLGIWVKMVVVQYQLFVWEVFFIGQCVDVVVVLWWGYVGVVVELVDLVGGGFDQQYGVMCQGDVYGCVQYLFVVVVDVVQVDVGVGVVGSKQGL